MKKFTMGSLNQIAKYIKIFFEGALEVIGLGKFQFEQGRLCNPENASNEQLGFVKKINNLIRKKLPQAGWVAQ